MWTQVTQSLSRATLGQRSMFKYSIFDVQRVFKAQRSTLAVQSITLNRNRRTNHTPPAHYLDKVWHGDTIGYRLLTVS